MALVKVYSLQVRWGVATPKQAVGVLNYNDSQPLYSLRTTVMYSRLAVVETTDINCSGAAAVTCAGKSWSQSLLPRCVLAAYAPVGLLAGCGAFFLKWRFPKIRTLAKALCTKSF